MIVPSQFLISKSVNNTKKHLSRILGVLGLNYTLAFNFFNIDSFNKSEILMDNISQRLLSFKSDSIFVSLKSLISAFSDLSFLAINLSEKPVLSIDVLGKAFWLNA